MSIVARLIERLTARPDGAPLLYAAEHLVKASDGAYRTLDIAAYPGLAMFHTVSCGAHVKVLSYWRSAEHFRACKAQFGAALGSAGKPYHGPVDHVAAAGKPWWRKASAYNAVVTLVAVLSTAKALEGHLDWFSAEPDVSFHPVRQHMNVVEGDAFEANLEVTNRAAVVQRLDIQASQAPPARGELSIDQFGSSISNLAPGSSHAMRVTGRALKPGESAVVVAVTAKAGLFRYEQVRSARIVVSVWPLAPFATGLRFDPSTGRAGMLRGQVINGPPAHDIECRVVIKGVPGLRYSGEGELITAGAPAKGNYVLVFRVGTKTAFKVTDIAQPLESQVARDWKKVEVASELRCFQKEPAS